MAVWKKVDRFCCLTKKSRRSKEKVEVLRSAAAHAQLGKSRLPQTRTHFSHVTFRFGLRLLLSEHPASVKNKAMSIETSCALASEDPSSTVPSAKEIIGLMTQEIRLSMAKLEELTNQRAQMLPIRGVYNHGGMTHRVRNEKRRACDCRSWSWLFGSVAFLHYHCWSRDLCSPFRTTAGVCVC
jgi:hypothetical protein